jgi:parallel beta-helix repeat protein
MSSNWQESLGRVFGSRKRTLPRRHPMIECLEARLVPADCTVINTNDAGVGANNAGDLRWCIDQINADFNNPNTINFNIPGPGPYVIKVNSLLPQIGRPVLISGYTQPGSSFNTLTDGDNAEVPVVLDGQNLAGNTFGLDIGFGHGSTVRGLALTGFDVAIRATGSDCIEGNFIYGNTSDGIELLGDRGKNTVGGLTPAGRNIISGNQGDGIYIDGRDEADLVEGNYIGTDASGTQAFANGRNGVRITSLNGDNTIGGVQAGAGNLLSGNNGNGVTITDGTKGNRIQGNLIGTDVTGTNPLANGGDGISISTSGNTVGGAQQAARNIISGNGRNGVEITNNANSVQGNSIGTDITGANPLANGGDGISISGNSNTVGGAQQGARNIISGNSANGVEITGNNNSVQGNSIGTTATGNSSSGVYINGGTGNTIGGLAAVAGQGVGNVISGNGFRGVRPNIAGVNIKSASGNVVQGNLIGTDPTGTNPLGNAGDGVLIQAGTSNIVGANGAGRNVISANGGWGISASGNQNQFIGNYVGTDITGNNALKNTSGGENAFGGGTNVFQNAKVAWNGGPGIQLVNETNDQVDSNTVLANQALGIDVESSSTTAITTNTVTGNIGDGIAIVSSAQTTLLSNTVNTNTGDGILLVGNLSGQTINTYLNGNYIGTDATLAGGLGNAGNGLTISHDADLTTLDGTNEIDNNAANGIWMVSLYTLTLSGTTNISNNGAFGLLLDLGMVWMPGVTTVNGSYEQGAAHVNLLQGQLTVTDSWLDISGTFNVGQGTLTTPLVEINDQGIVCGGGTIFGSVDVLGDVTAGANGQALHVTGNYTSQLSGVAYIGTGWSWDGQAAFALVVDGHMSLDYSFLFIASGSLTAPDLVTQNDSYVVLQVGTITTTYGFVLGSTCTFDANGTVIGDLENDGTINVGGSYALGVLTVAGNYTQSGLLNMELEATGHDALNISGVASLGGILFVTELGYIPPPYSAVIITWGQLNGGFEDVLVPPGFQWAYGSGGFVVWE